MTKAVAIHGPVLDPEKMKPSDVAAIIRQNEELHARCGVLDGMLEESLITQRGLAADNVRLQEQVERCKEVINRQDDVIHEQRDALAVMERDASA